MIIHEYKGHKIEKIEKHYAQGNEVYYRCDDGKICDRLKDAKKHIDNLK